MPRLSEAAGLERREALVSIAEEQFLKNGYENITVSNLTDSLNLAKGTFYYHFKSKEDLLVAVSERLINNTHQKLEEIHQRSDKDPIWQLKQMLNVLHDDFYRNRSIWKLVYDDRNISMHHKVANAAGKRLTPLIADVLQEGIESGQFDVPHPAEAAETLMNMFDLFSRRLCMHRSHEKRLRIFETLRHVLTALFGAQCIPDFQGSHTRPKK